MFNMYLPNKQDRAQGPFFKQNLTGLNSEFSFSQVGCHIRVKEPSLPYYLPKAEEKIVWSITSSRILVLWEIQTALSRIWTGVTMPISIDNNYNTTDTF